METHQYIPTYLKRWFTKTFKQDPTLLSKAAKGDQLRFQMIRLLLDSHYVRVVPGIMTTPASPPNTIHHNLLRHTHTAAFSVGENSRTSAANDF